MRCNESLPLMRNCILKDNTSPKLTRTEVICTMPHLQSAVAAGVSEGAIASLHAGYLHAVCAHTGTLFNTSICLLMQASQMSEFR